MHTVVLMSRIRVLPKCNYHHRWHLARVLTTWTLAIAIRCGWDQVVSNFRFEYREVDMANVTFSNYHHSIIALCDLLSQDDKKLVVRCCRSFHLILSDRFNLVQTNRYRVYMCMEIIQIYSTINSDKTMNTLLSSLKSAKMSHQT